LAVIKLRRRPGRRPNIIKKKKNCYMVGEIIKLPDLIAILEFTIYYMLENIKKKVNPQENLNFSSETIRILGY
jgi:hypothetical protein